MSGVCQCSKLINALNDALKTFFKKLKKNLKFYFLKLINLMIGHAQTQKV